MSGKSIERISNDTLLLNQYTLQSSFTYGKFYSSSNLSTTGSNSECFVYSDGNICFGRMIVPCGEAYGGSGSVWVICNLPKYKQNGLMTFSVYGYTNFHTNSFKNDPSNFILESLSGSFGSEIGTSSFATKFYINDISGFRGAAIIGSKYPATEYFAYEIDKN